MKILDKEVNFSFTEADNLAKLEAAIDIAQDKMSKINANEKTSVVITKTCSLISECFDSIFGEGFSKGIFEDKKEFRTCVKAFNDLLVAKNSQDEELEKEINALQDNINLANTKYSANRATRRANK